MAFRLLLHALGVLFAAASRASDRFRAQISRRVVVEIRSRDGVVHHFVFDGRRGRGASGPAERPDTVLEFATAGQGFRTLASPVATRKLVEGLLDGTIRIEGSTMLLLWFQGLAGMVAPIAGPLRLSKTPPHPYVAHTASPDVSRRITREPIADTLDPSWAGAAEARAKLRMIRGSKGEPLPPF